MTHFVQFPSTIWSTIQRTPSSARGDIFRCYSTPIFKYIQNQGFQDSDAEELAQRAFFIVCQEDFLRKVDSEKGKFRSLLLAVTCHVIQKEREKRSVRAAISIETGKMKHGKKEGPIEIPAKVPGDEAFDQFWVHNLLQLALNRLRDGTRQSGPRYYEAFVLAKLEGLSYEKIAQKLHVKESDIKNWVHQAKGKIRESIQEQVSKYCSSSEEHQEEIALLKKYLRQAGPGD